MTIGNLGTPDWQRGVVSSGIKLAAVAGGTGSVTVTITPNIKTLKIFTTGFDGPTWVTVKGVTSGIYYPSVLILTGYNPVYDQAFAAIVASEIDTQLIITPNAVPAHEWYVYGDNSSVMVSDANLAQSTQLNGFPSPPQGLVVMGSDGVDARILTTDNAGHLEVSLNNSQAPVQTAGAAEIGLGYLSMGSDGTDGRILKVDATGQLYIANPGGGATPQPRNGALVSQGILSMGSDGTDGRAMSTDSNGRQIPLVPTVGVETTISSGTTTLVAAPSTGAWYIFGVDWQSTTTGGSGIMFEDSLGNKIALCSTTAIGQVSSQQLNGFRTTGAIQVSSFASGLIIVRYAPGP
jgi:hypothetical protein